MHVGATVSDAAVSSQAAPTARKLAEMVAAYNPEREVVVCVANPAWEQWAALQVGHPFIMPPRAYKQSGEHAGMEIG